MSLPTFSLLICTLSAVHLFNKKIYKLFQCAQVIKKLNLKKKYLLVSERMKICELAI